MLPPTYDDATVPFGAILVRGQLAIVTPASPHLGDPPPAPDMIRREAIGVHYLASTVIHKFVSQILHTVTLVSPI